MANKVVLNLAGFRELRTSPKVVALVQETAEQLAESAGRGAEALQGEKPRNRARSAVVGSSRQADALLQALGSQMGRK